MAPELGWNRTSRRSSARIGALRFFMGGSFSGVSGSVHCLVRTGVLTLLTAGDCQSSGSREGRKVRVGESPLSLRRAGILWLTAPTRVALGRHGPPGVSP